MNGDTGGGFVFDLKAPRIRITDEELLEGLRGYVAVHGKRPFRVRDFRAWAGRPFEPNTVRRRFGSWRKALALVGVEYARAGKYDAEELMANLERVWKKLGRPPGVTLLGRHGRCGKQAYMRRWGSLRRACELLAAHHRGEMTREELLRAGRGRAKRVAKLPLKVRWRVLKRDGYQCAACGKSPEVGRKLELEVDHIVPVCRGGTDEEGNLRTLCWACNRGKGGRE